MPNRRAVLVVLSSLLLGSAARATEIPRLLADVNQQPDPNDPPPGVAHGFVPAGNGRIVFWTTDGGDTGLWSTDGTAAGTSWLPVPICPDPCIISLAGNLHGVALLKVRTGGTGFPYPTRLWRTDGTLSGTYPLTEILLDPDEPVLVEGSGAAFLAFLGCRATDGCGIWRSDGTAGGTALVKALQGPGGPLPHGLTAWHGRAYFFASGPTETALWATDGTAGGTVPLASVEEDEWSQLLGTAASRLFFTSGPFRQELWATDGSVAGTGLVKAFDVLHCSNPGAEGCPFINSFRAFGDGILFGAYDAVLGEDQYWSSDGTAAGTVRRLGFPKQISQSPSPILDDTLRRVGTHWLLRVVTADNSDIRLWVSDDDLASATPLTGCEGGCPTPFGFLGTEARTGGLLFAGSDPDHGQELWITDGTGPGTHRLTDVCPGPCTGFTGDPSPGLSLSGGTYFVAVALPDSFNRELWVTDGSPAGTRRIESLAADVGGMADVGVRDGLAYFTTPEGEVQVTDGTQAGNRRLTVLQKPAPSSSPRFAPVRSGAVMTVSEGEHQYLWASDGTTAGTHRLSDTPADNFFPLGFTAAGRLQFFPISRVGPENEFNQELWRTDGTEKGTFRVRAFSPGRLPVLAVDWNGKLLFQIYEFGPNRCSGWWISDGTSAGTQEILQFPRDVQCAEGVQTFGSQFLFFARVGTGRKVVPQIFVSDGTPADTRQVSHIEGFRDPIVSGLVRVGGTAIFIIGDRRGRATEVWRSDGSPQGTVHLANLPAEPASVLIPFRGAAYLIAPVSRASNAPLALWHVPAHGQPAVLHTGGFNFPLELVPLGDRLLFSADGGDGHGTELWQTDGTPAGTTLLKDINPGTGSSSPMGLTAAGGRVFFSAHDGLHGFELWESDGTAAGTRMVADLNPGPFSSGPGHFAVSGSNLFFAADDGVTGYEPWVLPLEPRTP
ncbi:MAG TPA: ELWxxDGT repeat protein [Thermoanaerobaculia bacterium]|nr:ELWxxDGT repeat protein [Thermoanaerobaculia bacterium]